jgi:hypothetical protein
MPVLIFVLKKFYRFAKRDVSAPLGVNVPGSIVGRFSGDPHWPDLGDP